MSDGTRKTTFAWASIAGADPEPVELITQDGRDGLYTLGCADPFWLDDVSAGIVVYADTLIRPENPETQCDRAKSEAEYKAYRRKYHGWRGQR